MFSRLFGSKKSKIPSSTALGSDANWSFLKTDMHSHLIPGIDDGAQTIEDSIALVKEFIELGYESVVTTPHIKSDYYPNDAAIINNGLNELRQALNDQGIHFPVKAAAEYYVDERFIEMLESGPLMTVNDKEVLIEFSFVFEPMRINEILFQMQTKGYKPVIAHPERYNYYHLKPNTYRELKDRGCLLQLNAISLTGYYGRTVKEAAENLLDENLYDYCGSDAHHLRHLDTMRKLMRSRRFAQLYHYPFLNRKITF
jgi:protein-tyrosine phosphatase